MIRHLISGAASAIACALLAGAAVAAPAQLAAGAKSEPGVSLIQKVHGCHFDTGPGMAPDRYNGTHYHNRQCAVVRVGRPQQRSAPPPRRAEERRRSDDGPRRDVRRGDRSRLERRRAPPRRPVCKEVCQYIGPFKSCKTVCN